MTQATESALAQIALQIFEELCFIFPTLEIDSRQLKSPANVMVSLKFAGSRTGRLTLSISSNLLPELTANMLGETETTSEQERRDALGEIANVICGNLLPRLFGADAVFQLAQPIYHAGTWMREPGPEAPSAVSRIGLEQGQAELMLFLD